MQDLNKFVFHHFFRTILCSTNMTQHPRKRTLGIQHQGGATRSPRVMVLGSSETTAVWLSWKEGSGLQEERIKEENSGSVGLIA